MNTYGYNLDTTHQAIIFELGTEAADSSKLHHRFTPGAIVGSSQFGIIEEDNARRICAALTFFSDIPTAEIEHLSRRMSEIS
tara:strand:+ start:471 stop:716 length:246 start_codon:yes stop_codon:yes gene_type:complete